MRTIEARDPEARPESLAAMSLQELRVVTNEVGMGIVPGDALARRYRDALGWANARIAHVTDRVILMVSGLLIQVKRRRAPNPSSAIRTSGGPVR